MGAGTDSHYKEKKNQMYITFLAFQNCKIIIKNNKRGKRHGHWLCRKYCKYKFSDTPENPTETLQADIRWNEHGHW